MVIKSKVWATGRKYIDARTELPLKLRVLRLYNSVQICLLTVYLYYYYYYYYKYACCVSAFPVESP